MKKKKKKKGRRRDNVKKKNKKRKENGENLQMKATIDYRQREETGKIRHKTRRYL